MEGDGDYRRNLGQRGEEMSCRFLEGMGHTILERNWRSGHLEIDIISIDADGIHFVEVKTRQRNIQAPPQENVNRSKQMKITKAAVRYLKAGKGVAYGNLECFFDVIAISLEEGKEKIDWFPQAYIPIYL